MAQAMRGTLRKLAVTLGLIAGDADSFSLKAPEIYEILSKTIPNIADLSEEEVSELINEAKANGGGGKPAPAKPAAAPAKAAAPTAGPKAPAKPGPKPAGPPKPGPKAAPVEEPTEEEVVDEGEAPAEEEAPTPPKRGPGRPPAAPGGAPKPGPAKPGPKPGPRPTVAADPVVEPTSQSSAPKVDLKPIIDRIDTIGTLTDANQGAIKKIQAEVAEIHSLLSSLDQYLTWQYNNDAEEKINSLTDIAWNEGG